MKQTGLNAIQMNDFRSQWIECRDQVLSAVDRVGQSGWLILGSEVERFEDELANYWGRDFAIGCASGLDAIEIALRATGLKAGEKVLTTPLSAFATTPAIIRAGGVPVFVDVDASGQIDLDLCDHALSHSRDIRFLVPVHLYGHAIEHRGLETLRNKFGITIIEDCAQAISAKSDGRPIGCIGQFATTSFYPTKNLGCMGDGGALLCDSKGYYDRARTLRDYGQKSKFEHTEPGLNSRLDEIQAAILLDALLPKLDNFTQKRQQIADRYRIEIKHPSLKQLPVPKASESVWHLYPLIVSGDRDSFRRHLHEFGISSAVHYPTIIPQQKAMEAFRTDTLITPVDRAKSIAKSEVSIPIHPHLSDRDIEDVVAACNSWER